VHALATHETATVTEASDAYLATLAGPESAGTRRVYSGVLRALAEDLGADADVATLQPRPVAAWFTGRWGERSPTREDIGLRERGHIMSTRSPWSECFYVSPG
jgi:hypothetical protein